VVHTRVYVEGDSVDCIYFEESKCWAAPFAEGEEGVLYKPTEVEKKQYCLNTKNFRKCPRFKAYQDDLKFRGLQKEEKRVYGRR
jgi:hypothetical protein